MFKDREWITYETLENIRKRAAYVVANNLGGMFIWSRMFHRSIFNHHECSLSFI